MRSRPVVCGTIGPNTLVAERRRTETVRENAEEPHLESDEVVLQERLCISCGYSLVGLPIAGPCLECGTPVERSLQSGLLEHADASYVRRIAFGVGRIRLGAVLAWAFLLAVIANILANYVNGPGPSTLLVQSIKGCTAFGALLAAFVAVASSLTGWWYLTSRDPGIALTNKAESLRWRTRALFALWLILTFAPIAFFAWGFEPSTTRSPLASAWFGPLLSLAAAICMVLWWRAAMRHTRIMGDRIPSTTVRSRSRACVWLAIAVASAQLALAGASVARTYSFRNVVVAMRYQQSTSAGEQQAPVMDSTRKAPLQSANRPPIQSLINTYNACKFVARWSWYALMGLALALFAAYTVLAFTLANSLERVLWRAIDFSIPSRPTSDLASTPVP